MKTDTQLQEDIYGELKWEPATSSTDIGVEVSNGIATLLGHVGSYSEKIAAERAVQRVGGVKGLAVAIEVKLPGSSHRDDTDTARTAANVLSWSTYAPDDNIKVLVEDGWITLTGEVKWDFQKRGACAAVRDLMGVVGAIDHMRIKDVVSAVSLKSDIEAALKRRAHNDAHAVSVDVKGSNLTLTGTVHDCAERDLVNHAV